MGRTGTVTTDLAPVGAVLVASESWSAVAEGDEVIEVGESVRVVGLDGLTLRVSKTGD